MDFQFKYLKLSDKDDCTVMYDRTLPHPSDLLETHDEAMNYCLYKRKSIDLIHLYGNTVEVIYRLRPSEILKAGKKCKRISQSKFGIERICYVNYDNLFFDRFRRRLNDDVRLLNTP